MSPDGDDGYVITNNVFQISGYPWPVVMGGCAGCTVTHNTFVGGSLEIGTANNGGPSSGVVARDNVFSNGSIVILGSGNTYTATYNLNSGVAGTGNINGTPTFAGGATKNRDWYQLAPGSIGTGAASDGTNIGIH